MKRIELINKSFLSEEQKKSLTISSAAKLEVADFFKRLFFIGLIIVLTSICITSFAQNTNSIKDSVKLKRHHQLGINLSTPILMLGAGQSKLVTGQLTYKNYFKKDKRALRLDFIYTNTYDEFAIRGGSIFTNHLSGKIDTIYGGYSTRRRESFLLALGMERKFKSKVVDIYVASLAHIGLYKEWGNRVNSNAMLHDTISIPTSSNSLKFNANSFNYSGDFVGADFIVGLAKQFNKHWSATIETKLSGTLSMYNRDSNTKSYTSQSLVENKNETFYARQIDFNYSPLLQNISLYYHF